MEDSSNGENMQKSHLYVIIAVVAVVVIAVAAFAIMNNNSSDEKNSDEKKDDTILVTDSVGREVAVPKDLSKGIVTCGWSCLQALAFFDADQYAFYVDQSEKESLYAELQPHYYSYSKSQFKYTHADSSVGDIEDIKAKDPALVIVAGDVYDAYKADVDTLTKGVPTIVVATNTINFGFYVEKEGGYEINPALVAGINVLGKAFGQESKAASAIKALNDVLDDIVKNQVKDKTNGAVLLGTEMYMCSGELSNFFPGYDPFVMAGVTNAAASVSFPFASDPELIGTLDIDTIFYDPSNPERLKTENSQKVLMYLYNHPEIKIYCSLTTALAGWNMTNVMNMGYFSEVIIGDLSKSDMESKMVNLYKSLYGDSVGSEVYQNVVNAFNKKMDSYNLDIDLWNEITVVKNTDGSYTFKNA